MKIKLMIAVFSVAYIAVNMLVVEGCRTGAIHPPFDALFLFAVVFPVCIFTACGVGFVVVSGTSDRLALFALVVLAVCAGALNYLFFYQAVAAV